MLSLSKIALELLQINEDFSFRLKNPRQNKISDFELYTFTQVWGNTSGGFESMGGCAMTEQRTYVLVPLCEEDCLVYFGGKFAYSVPYSPTFMNDVDNENVAGVLGKDKYL